MIDKYEINKNYNNYSIVRNSIQTIKLIFFIMKLKILI